MTNKISLLQLLIIVISFIRSSNCYQSLSLDSICAPFHGNVENIFLKNGNQSAVRIESYNNNSSAYLSECVFTVDASKYHSGIILVVSNLKLTAKQDGTCVDSLKIQFLKGTFESEELCGHIQLRSFNDMDGIMKVTIKQSQLGAGVNPMDLSLVFTGYSDCITEMQFSCHRLGKHYCIYKSFVGDKIFNCPIPDCLDEDGCYDVKTVKRIDYSNIAISAITSLIFTMVGVVLCGYICWRYKDCIRECVGVNINSNIEPNVPPTIELQEPQAQIHQVPVAEQDKDLPPSYDSLFPAR